MIFVQYLSLCCCLLLQVQALYEDQAGKFDWRKQLVGRPHSVLLDGYQPLVVITEQNVLAAINHKSGELLWRRVLERGAAGRPRLLMPYSDDRLVTYSGANLMRVWSAASGQLISETMLDVPDTAGATHVLAASDSQEVLVVQLSAEGSVLRRVTIDTGEFTSETLSTPWPTDVSCVAGSETLLCRDAAQLYTFSADTGRFSAAPLPPPLAGSPPPRLLHLGGDLFSAAAGGRLAVVRATPAFETVREMAGDVACLTGPAGQEVLYVGTNDRSRAVPAVQFAAVSVSGRPTSAPAGRVVLSSRHGLVSSCHVSAAPAAAPRLLLVGEDDAVTMAEIGGGVLWTREEALASIQAVEVVDLPMSANQVSIEEEFGDQAADPVSALLLRMSSQWSQLTALAAGVVSPEPDRDSGVTHLTRDSFNTHKMLVVVTACGKLLGLHSETGVVLWAAPVAGLAPLSASSVVLGLQRGTAHFPHPPVAVALLERRTLVTFNPITGGDLAVHRLAFESAQASLLAHTDNTHLKPLLILDTEGAVHVWPDTAAPLAKSLYSKLFFYLADVGSSTMQGYAVTQSLETVPSWRLDLASQGQTIRRVLAKSPHERVHSQGRVLADRSVLYKYSNPNLVLVLTDAPDPVHKHTTSAYLVDAVTGHLVYSHVQRRVRCPCHAVHSENWLVYSVYNERLRRTEVTSIELFEGKVQANASAFSSLEAPPQPMVEKQSFIFPSQIEAMRETITEKSITTKFIIFALPSGSLVTLNRAFLDPRRPLTPGHSGMEEGLPPYMPELPLPTNNVVNYNQTLLNVANIVTSPSGLESTCLVFVYGLDLYHTRVFPSNMFDQLKDDFDSMLIVLVLAGLITASAVTRRLSQRKALQHAWK